MSVDDWQQKRKPKCRLDMFNLKHLAGELVIILRTAIENNSNNPPIQQNNQPKLADINPTNRNQASPALAPAPPICIWLF